MSIAAKSSFVILFLFSKSNFSITILYSLPCQEAFYMIKTALIMQLSAILTDILSENFS